MANTNFPLKPAPHGNRAEISGLGGGRIHWPMTPEVTWVATVHHSDLAAAEVTTVLTIPALTDSGRLTGTYSRGGVEVQISVDLVDGDDQDTLASDLAGVLVAEGAPFDTWMVSATPGPGAGQLTIVWAAGGLVTQAYEYEPAQILELAALGTLAAGNYGFTVTGAGLEEPVVVTLAWGGGTEVDFGIALEAAFEGETDLDDVVVSANDDGAGTCAVLFAPGLAAASIAVVMPHSYELTTGGVPADGDYVATVESAQLPAPVPVTVTRLGGAPATNALIAAAFEAAFEAHPQLAPLVISADDTGAVNAIETYAGVELSFTTSAPTGATLVATDESEVAVSDETPAAPTITQSHALELALNEVQPRNAFPANVCRLECPLVRRIVAWSHTATITLDNAGAASTDVLAAVSVSSGTGWLGDTGTSLGSVDVPEAAWNPRLVLTTATLSPTAGEFEIHVGFCPLPS